MDPMLLAPVVQHLGALHPIEKVLTFGLAFGPFAGLGLLIAVRRRRDGAEESEADPSSQDPQRAR